MRRRSLLQASLLVPLGARVVSAAPAAEAVTPALIEAARKEGKVTYYTAMDLSVAERNRATYVLQIDGIVTTSRRHHTSREAGVASA